MPVSNTSRYFGLDVYDAEDDSGVSRPTVSIRPTTTPPRNAVFYRHPLTGLEDIEYLAWRFFGSSDSWWRIAEANPLVFPLDLRPGMTVNVPAPGDVGRIVRTRRF
ncbi:MAG TPA: hypothetical protein VF591_25915 [Pyrinomonadaceae bacterium]|jgi:hypothetical protein